MPLTNLWGNSAWRVRLPFVVCERLGVIDNSNTWVGAAKVLSTVYREVEVQPGDIILGLAGGDFLLREQGPDGRWRAVPIVQAVSEKHPFEKNYGGIRPFPQRWAGKPIVEDSSFYIGANIRYAKDEVLTALPGGARQVGRNIDWLIPRGA